MKYVLAAVAGIWMADGLSLLVAPKIVIGQLRELLARSPWILNWQTLVAGLGLLLVIGSQGLQFQPLWAIVGSVMIVKGGFLALAPDPVKRQVLDWCLHREEIDYRFWGLGLCTLAMLLLHALGWLRPG